LTKVLELAPAQARANPLRAVAAVSLLAMGVCILAFAMTANNAANRDFVCYWAAGQQLVHHGNPYDGPAILRIQRSAGFTDNRPFFMRNPPSAFFLALPLGFVGVKTGVIFWSLAIIAALMASIRMLWRMHGQPPDRLHLVGYIFPPALACLLAGQIGIFLLLGIVLFLYFHKSLPYFAGAALLLCALKPHLFVPLGIVLLAWILSQRAYRVLAGAGSAILASLALSLFLDPSGWSHYAQMASEANLKDEFIPTLSLMLRLAVHRNFLWLQFVLALAASLWALWYFYQRRNRWNWMEHGSILLLVSVMVAPYAWFTDEAVLLPAILAGLYQASNRGRSLLPFGCIAGVALIEVLARVSLNSGFYLWTAPAWFAWYLYAVSVPDTSVTSPLRN
jgi:Glycosyltransferase family 87